MSKLIRLLVVVAVLAPLQACYYVQAARGQLELLAKREPVAELIASPETPADLREKLELAQRMRAFAVDELGLPDNDSYAHYVDLDRAFVVWSVVATLEFSVQPVTWCFPFAGCVAYRGYFREEAARRFAERYAARGHDVRVGGVSAYSTLGWFADPLLSSMIRNDEIELAAVLFHELAHQRLYVRGDTRFNEAFATVVEEEGVRRWLESRGRPDAIDEYRRRRAQRDEFAQLVADARAELETLYASGGDPDAIRTRKARVFERLRERHRTVRDERWGGRSPYERWFERELNNADLAAVGTYNAEVPPLRALLEELDRDLVRFYTEAAGYAERAR